MAPAPSSTATSAEAVDGDTDDVVPALAENDPDEDALQKLVAWLAAQSSLVSRSSFPGEG